MSSSSRLTTDNFEEFHSQAQAAALKATRNALALPSDIDFHRSMDSEFSTELDIFSARILSMTNKFLSLASNLDPNGKGKAKLESPEDLADNFESLIVDTMDQLLERADTCLDRFSGKNKKPAIPVNPIPPKAQGNLKRAPDPVIQHAAHLQKPQLSFKTPVDNTDRPWYPNLPHKFNAQVPLGYHFRDMDMESGSDPQVNHPYLYEIKHIKYPPHLFEAAPPIPVDSFDQTPFHWISTVEQLDALLEKLKKATEIAIDLEHHDYRTFAGFLCLMQISTREEDFIIDVLVLRDELLALNEVFTNPNILKVMHGAESDIVWLQQNFNLYIVNLFDTFHASKILDFPRHGLAQLLEMYCDFIPDKRFQLADWRIRPLPQDMLHYARADTHFLLFVYDNLRNALLDRAQSRAQSRSGSPSDPNRSYPSASADSLVRQVLTRSEETCLNLYQREPYDTERGSGSAGWDTLARKWNKLLFLASATLDGPVAVPKEVYKAVHSWRDTVGRQEDESTRYVLANHFLFKLAEQPPTDMAALMHMFPSMPPIIKKRANELLEVIRNAVKPTVVEPAQQDPTEQIVDTVSISALKSTVPVSGHGFDLWRTDSWPTASLAAKSSLFGSTFPSTQESNGPAFSTSTSTFFGHAVEWSLAKKPQNRFKEVVNRIHSSLIVLPSLSKVDHTDLQAEDETPDLPQSEVLTMEVEIPFVPAERRQTRELITDDTVIVGQIKRKKRKRIRDDNEPNVEIPEETSKTKRQKKGKEPSSPEPFDFASAPNILDDTSVVEAEMVPAPKKKNKKDKKGDQAGVQTERPPRSSKQVRNGNKSSTFR